MTITTNATITTNKRTRSRTLRKLDLEKKEIPIGVNLVSPKVFGAQIMHGRFIRIETEKHDGYLVTIRIKGTLRLEDLLPQPKES